MGIRKLNNLTQICFCVFCGFLFCTSICLAQNNQDLNEFGNRFEGVTTESIAGTANLQIISFVSYFQDFQWHRSQNLKIRYYLDEPKNVQVLVQQTKGNVIYRMLPKSVPKEIGFNEFGPWPVDDMLSSLQLSKDELGVTVKDDNTSILYPASVYYSKDSLNLQQYQIQFLPKKSLYQVKFSLFQGLYINKEINQDSLIYNHDFRKRTKIAGELFQLSIEGKDLKVDLDWQGWVTVVMKAKNYEDDSKVTEVFYFYHKPF